MMTVSILRFEMMTVCTIRLSMAIITLFLLQASVDFSNYQLAKLRRQNKLTQKIESVRRDMNAKTSGNHVTIALSRDPCTRHLDG